MSFLLPALMLVGLAAALFSGLPVAVVLIGVAFLFAGLGILAGSVRIEEMGAIFHRVYGTLSDRDEVLYAAVPMLLFMGAVLHESRLAADLLAGAARLFGRVRGGPALATLAVAAIQAPAAGMVGASTGALALYALPALRGHGYGTQEAAGLVAAAGTLGVVAPPGIMLFFVAEAIGAQVPALFLAMLGPLALLLVLYFAYAVVRGSPRPVRENAEAVRAVDALVPALLMIGLVVIVALGYATISEAAGLAALGAVLAAVARGRMSWSALDAAIRRTALVSAMIFFIFVGASVFSLVFRLLGGQAMISAAAAALGSRGAVSLITAMIFVFVLGFFLDWLEIVVIALPALAGDRRHRASRFGERPHRGRRRGAIRQCPACSLLARRALCRQPADLVPDASIRLRAVPGARRHRGRGDDPAGVARRASLPGPAARHPRCRGCDPGAGDLAACAIARSVGAKRAEVQ